MADQSESSSSSSSALDLKLGDLVTKLSSLVQTIERTIPKPEAIDKEKLLADYAATVDVVKLLSDIRFRCLVFVTSIVAVANALIPGAGNPGTRIAFGCVGLLATLGITVYELRNSQLYEAALHRAKQLEEKLTMLPTSRSRNEGGLFAERPRYVSDNKWVKWTKTGSRGEEKDTVPLLTFCFLGVQHDRALALIYAAVLGGWVFLIADGVLGLPAPERFWKPLPEIGIHLIAAAIAVAAFVFIMKRFVRHDKERHKPKKPCSSPVKGFEEQRSREPA